MSGNRFNPSWILGKTIDSICMRTRKPEANVGTLHDPIIRFTDGSSIVLVPEESPDVSGVGILYVPKQKGAIK